MHQDPAIPGDEGGFERGQNLHARLVVPVVQDGVEEVSARPGQGLRGEEVVGHGEDAWREGRGDGSDDFGSVLEDEWAWEVGELGG